MSLIVSIKKNEREICTLSGSYKKHTGSIECTANVALSYGREPKHDIASVA